MSYRKGPVPDVPVRPDAHDSSAPEMVPMTLGLVPDVLCRSFGLPSEDSQAFQRQAAGFQSASGWRHPQGMMPGLLSVSHDRSPTTQQYGDAGAAQVPYGVPNPCQMPPMSYGGPAIGSAAGMPGYGAPIFPYETGHAMFNPARMFGTGGFYLPQDMSFHLQQLQQQQQHQTAHQQQQQHQTAHQQQAHHQYAAMQQQQAPPQQQQHHHHHHSGHQMRVFPQQASSVHGHPATHPLLSQGREVPSDQQHATQQAVYTEVQLADVSSDGARNGKRQFSGTDTEIPLQPLKRSRVVWTKELHQRFEEALEKAGGIDVAVPKTVLEYMAIPGLSRDNVASHLQKHRIQVKKKDRAAMATALSSPVATTSNGVTNGHATNSPAATGASARSAAQSMGATDTAFVNGSAARAPARGEERTELPRAVVSADDAEPAYDIECADNGQVGDNSGKGDTSGNMTSGSSKTAFRSENMRNGDASITPDSVETGHGARARANGGMPSVNNLVRRTTTDAAEQGDATSADTGRTPAEAAGAVSGLGGTRTGAL